MAEREFRAPTDGGEIVGWIQDAPGKPSALLLHDGPGMSEYLDTLVGELDGLVTTARYQQRGLAPSVLVVHGSRSPIPVAEARRIAAIMPTAKLVVHEGKGHWPWLEEPGFVRTQLAAWLPRSAVQPSAEA